MGRGLAALLRHRAEPRQPALRELALELIRPNPSQPRQRLRRRAPACAGGVDQGARRAPAARGAAASRRQLRADRGRAALRAAKIAGLEQVPAIVRETEDAERLELALIENMAREDLNPIEEGRACATLVDDLGVTREELGRRVGRSRVAISNAVRLLDLPDEVQAMIQAGELSAGPRPRAAHVQGPRRAAAAGARGARPGLVGARDRAARKGGARPARASRPAAARRSHPPGSRRAARRVAEDELTAALGHEVRCAPRGAGCRVEFGSRTRARRSSWRPGCGRPRRRAA